VAGARFTEYNRSGSDTGETGVSIGRGESRRADTRVDEGSGAGDGIGNGDCVASIEGKCAVIHNSTGTEDPVVPPLPIWRVPPEIVVVPV